MIPLKKRIVRVLRIIIKSGFSAILWYCGITVMFSTLILTDSFIITIVCGVIELLICSLLVLERTWKKTLQTWCISVLFFSLVWMPLIYKIPQALFDLSLDLDLIFAFIGYIIAYIFSTFTSTFLVMLGYESIQKKHKTKKLDEYDTSDDNKD